MIKFGVNIYGGVYMMDCPKCKTTSCITKEITKIQCTKCGYKSQTESGWH